MSNVPSVQTLSGVIVDSDAIEIGGLYQKAGSSIVGSVRYQVQCGIRLAEKKAELGHGPWLPWLKDNAEILGFNSDRTAQRLINLGKVNPTLTSDLDAGRAIQICRQTWGNETITNMKSSEKQDWMTPIYYVEAARKVMGSIDLDPATSEVANKHIRAEQFFTEEDDGLSQPWAGTVWLNPPYGGAQAQFSAKLRAEYEDSRVSEGILLVNAAATDTEWFQPLWDYLLCFTDHRISFVSGNGQQKGNTSGSVFVYFGQNQQRFAEIFNEFGTVVARYEI